MKKEREARTRKKKVLRRHVLKICCSDTSPPVRWYYYNRATPILAKFCPSEMSYACSSPCWISWDYRGLFMWKLLSSTFLGVLYKLFLYCTKTLFRIFFNSWTWSANTEHAFHFVLQQCSEGGCLGVCDSPSCLQLCDSGNCSMTCNGLQCRQKLHGWEAVNLTCYKEAIVRATLWCSSEL